MQDLIDSEFNSRVLDSEKPVLVDFWAPWCGPCRMVSPVLEQIAKERDDLEIMKLNIDDNPETAARYSVMSIPTMILFKDGTPLGQLVGAKPKAEIESQLNQLLGA